MESCQICGKPAVGEGFVEGARVPLCPNCVRFGNRFDVYDEYKPKPPAPRPRLKEDEHFVEHAGASIKAAREAKGWDRAQLGKRLFISETDIRAFEEDRRKPTPAQVEKLEHELGIKLLEKDAPQEDKKDANRPAQAKASGPRKTQEFTLGDIVTIKKK